jgi:hypothetical protein
MHSYWQAPRMTFDVRERVVFAHVNSRYPPYLQTLFAKDQIHYLAARRDLGFEHGLKVLGLRFSSESINGYTLYNPFRFQSPAGRSVRFRQDLVVSTSETGAIPALSDSNGATFYRLRQSQCLNLELKSPTPLTGVLLTMANRLNVPQEIVIKDGETGLKLMKVNRFYPGYFIGEHPYLPYSPGHCEYRFPGHRTHRLQLCVARAVPMGWYALSEVGLFQRSDDSKTDASLKPFFQQHLAASEAVYSSPGAVVRLKQHDGFRRNRLWADSNKDKQVIFDRINLLVFESAYLEHNRRILAASGVKHRWAQGPVFAAIATTPAAGASALYWCGGRMLLTGKPPR